MLQFDDGCASWVAAAAPVLAKRNGNATAFVNNQNVHNGRISWEELRSLQDDFGWEIGTHTYNHHNAIRFVQQHGLEHWQETQLDASVAEFREAGLRVDNLVFPFNAYSPELARRALERGLTSYRRADPIALGPGLRPDGSLPGTSIDLTRYLPLPVLRQWIDRAASQGQLLFLYGHRVLPDADFAAGRVVEVSENEIVAETEIVLPRGEDVVLVPDIARRSSTGSLGGVTIEGNRIRIPAGSPSLLRLTAPGSTFLIGPAYGTRLSDFTQLIEYAAQMLPFYTVADIVAGRHQPVFQKTGAAGDSPP